MNVSSVFVYPKRPLADGIHVVSTTRGGLVPINMLGNRSDVYASFNLGLHCGDAAEHVLANRELLKQKLQLPSTPCWLSQVHGTDILKTSQSIDSNPNADGLYTQSSGVVCAVMTADCLPLVLCDKDSKQVMAVHAGWRGIAAGIVEKAVGLFECSPKAIRAWAGPCIGPKAFEIGAEVVEQLGGNKKFYTPSSDNFTIKETARYYADLASLVGERLREQGVNHYSHSRECTYQNQERFFSYRRDGQTGRMATLIWKQF